MSPRSRILRPAIALTALASLLAACADNDADPSDETADTSASQGGSTTPSDEESRLTEKIVLPAGVLALPEPDGDEDAVVLEAGRWVPLSETLSFDVDVPPGTEASNGGLYLAVQETVLKVEAAGEDYGVPSDPCSAYTDIEPAGPTVDNLVGAIRNQPIYRAGRPEPIEFEGAGGQYFELRIPRGYDAPRAATARSGSPVILARTTTCRPATWVTGGSSTSTGSGLSSRRSATSATPRHPSP